MKKNFLFLSITLIFVLSLSACTNENSASYNDNQGEKSVESINMNNNQNSNQGISSKDEVSTISGRTLPKQKDLAQEYGQALIKTNQGNIKIKFYGEDSPMTVNNFFNLAQEGFYNGTKFHRVIKDFMIQGGDPNSKDDDWSNDGMGGPGYKFGDEFNKHTLVRGSLAMANSGPNTNGSQFFIVTAESTPWLDGKHVNLGEVIEGMDVVDKIENMDTNENDHPLKDATINSIELIK
jgi:cyclophilin family peptidyl-prolyl cis-trans isomerase